LKRTVSDRVDVSSLSLPSPVTEAAVLPLMSPAATDAAAAAATVAANDAIATLMCGHAPYTVFDQEMLIRRNNWQCYLR